MNHYITGNTIRVLREKKQITQKELAQILGVCDKTISKWETAKGYPDISLLEPLAAALDISVAELLSGDSVSYTHLDVYKRQFISSSATLSTATISFSAIQGRLLSKVHPFTISAAAFLTSAVSSTSAGGFPAPAPIPLFPEERTAVTTPGPPVAAIRGISLCFIMILLVSSVGLVTVQATLSLSLIHIFRAVQ